MTMSSDGFSLDTASRLSIVRRHNVQYAVKRSYDLISALLMIVFLSPVMLAVAALIRLQGDGPVVFSQKRIGENGKAFHCYKFRTMVVNAEEQLAELLARDPKAAAEWHRDQKLQDDPRVTSLGRFLRRSSLDELPQIFNILKGEMSLVGPRPIVSNEIKRYGIYFDAYTSVKPGVTGLWQVSGRNDLSYEERVRLDVHYAMNWTVLGDIGLTLKTVPAVLLSRGAS